jgi:hypothetical protein
LSELSTKKKIAKGCVWLWEESAMRENGDSVRKEKKVRNIVNSMYWLIYKINKIEKWSWLLKWQKIFLHFILM